jgi:phosphonate transport system permease protein
MIKLPNNVTPDEIAKTRDRFPSAFGRPVPHQILILFGWGLFVALVFYTLVDFGFTFERIYYGLGKLGHVISFMFPPFLYEDLAGWTEILYAIAETVAMAFMGTLMASFASLFLGFLGAKNIMHYWPFHFTMRRGFDILRALEQLILALIFIRAFGLGPLSGIFAIAVSDMGSLSKLYSEAIENIDNKPLEGVKSAGASHLQIIRLSILPQVLPVMISTSLYYLESNTRTATILGIVGAGGIGFLLDERIRANNWDEVMTIVIMLLITVATIDRLSRFLRMKIIGDTSKC